MALQSTKMHYFTAISRKIYYYNITDLCLDYANLMSCHVRYIYSSDVHDMCRYEINEEHVTGLETFRMKHVELKMSLVTIPCVVSTVIIRRF